MENELFRLHNINKKKIRDRLNDFKNLDENAKFNEMLFCLLTPQSNAKKCWAAVEKLSRLRSFNQKEVSNILKEHTRFHNNKTKYILEAEKTWKIIKNELNNKDKIALRNFIAENVSGYGLKEASHFLRNIGKSDNKIAILDRHILRNLVNLDIINDDKIKNKKHYLEIEQKFLSFAEKINIPIDELDLLFWSKENGEIFK